MITRQLRQVKIRSTILRCTVHPVINYLPSVSYQTCLSRRKNRAGGHSGRWIHPAEFMNALRHRKTVGGGGGDEIVNWKKKSIMIAGTPTAIPPPDSQALQRSFFVKCVRRSHTSIS